MLAYVNYRGGPRGQAAAAWRQRRRWTPGEYALRCGYAAPGTPRGLLFFDSLRFAGTRLARSVSADLARVERELREMGHADPRGTPFTLSDGRSAATGCLPTLTEIRERITGLVNGLKAKCRTDERLYAVCGELVHLRVRTREVSFDEWLGSRELGLLAEVAADLRANRGFVEGCVSRFYGAPYDRLRRLGLQSALKYEEVYLASLERGGKESMGQFFARLAAAAATQATRVPQLASALSPGCPGWRGAFSAFFWALAEQAFVPATPVMLFLGRAGRSTASCYLVDPRPESNDDAIQAVVDQVVPLLKARGGIGLALQRYNDARTGLMHILKMVDALVVAANAESVRPTGCCVYLEPWHSDVLAVLSMRGALAPEEARRCDNLFAALWTPDLLFKRYERHAAGEPGVAWTLFDSRANHLCALYGDEFEREYERLEAEGLGVATVPVRDLMFAIVKSAAVTGSPFVVFKDACNRHYHLDTRGDALTCSNLCTEIVQKTDASTTGVCSLASVNLARCVRVGDDGVPAFDYDALRRAARAALLFVNATMACTDRPTLAAGAGLDRHRSVGIGVQGLHTALLALGLDMLDEEARRVNRRVFETLLLETMSASCDLCELGLEPFPEFADSSYAAGRLHFDAWDGVELYEPAAWTELRERVAKFGLYNSQFVALMPTAASAQVTEVSEGFAPLYSNLFSKVTLTGELLRPNPQLMAELRALYANDEAARLRALDLLEAAGWSVKAALGDRPECASLAKFKTAFEYDQRALIDLCRDRAPFVDQSQSMTLFVTEMADGTLPASRVMTLLMRAYKCGLKTGMYYCKIQKATNSGIFSGSGELVCTACHL